MAMEENKDKRVLRVELNDDVKKVSITGKNEEEQVVMRQELDEDELDMVTGGTSVPKRIVINQDVKNNFLKVDSIKEAWWFY